MLTLLTRTVLKFDVTNTENGNSERGIANENVDGEYITASNFTCDQVFVHMANG